MFDNKVATPKVVIGLGWGDEGKGRTVDYLTSLDPNSVVVRFSGGQQAGHTVMRDNVKHIFSNYGSGTFNNCTTYISEHCTIYPLTMLNEYRVLKKKGYDPKIVIHPKAKLTTPYEILANRKSANNKAHGTCGLGIGKTNYREDYTPYHLYAVDLLNPDLLVEKMAYLSVLYPEIDNKENREEFKSFLEAVTVMDWDIQGYEFLKNRNLVFEGSQGVMLDKDHGVFPHVTYSNTTSKNAIEICEKLGHTDVEIYGITRTYHTRHGNGPFPEKKLPLINNEEETCVYNEWQGEFKTADLDYDILNQAIEFDKIYSNKLNRSFILVVTCNDQLDVFDLNKVKNKDIEVMFFHSPINHKKELVNDI